MPLDLVTASPRPGSRASKRIDVRKLRLSLSMSQPEFATKFGFNVCTLRQWEQDRRRPDRAARVLLMVISHCPEMVMRAIEGGHPAP